MTATERRYRGKGDKILSMDNAAIYGDTFHLLSFKRALEATPPILSDYRIVTILVSRDKITDMVRKNVFLRPDKGRWDKELEAEIKAAGYGSMVDINENKVRNVYNPINVELNPKGTQIINPPIQIKEEPPIKILPIELPPAPIEPEPIPIRPIRPEPIEIIEPTPEPPPPPIQDIIPTPVQDIIPTPSYGGGGGNTGVNTFAPGSGGGLTYKNNITVVPGNSYTIIVGNRGGSGTGVSQGGTGAVRLIWSTNQAITRSSMARRTAASEP